MRRVKITKQQTVNPKAVYMGLSIKQILIMVIGVVIAIATFILFFINLKIDVNITMTLVFIELLVFASISIIKINGMNLLKWIYTMLQQPIFRPYQSKGMLDTYEKKQEKNK